MVHVIFKTHLDLGFTDSAANVRAAYMRRHIPHALALAKAMRQAGDEERFIWTTGSWLIYEFLETASLGMRRRMEEGILAGDIAWHALPFTMHSEFMNSSLFRFALELSRKLDQRFGRRTIAAKMSDVPGHTRAIIPLLCKAGVRFLHIGGNISCRPPDVPPLFVWKSPDGASIIMNFTKGGYGKDLSCPGLDEALVFAHTGDNVGPQGQEQVRGVFEQLRAQYPGAAVRASTLDAFARRVRKLKDHLPVIEAEIGDTWIHGIGADPLKTARFRELGRWVAEQEKTAMTQSFRKRVWRCCRSLICVAEHTWGKDVKTYLGDHVNYARPAFDRARKRDLVTAPFTGNMKYAKCFTDNKNGPRSYSGLEASWREQRQYVTDALKALGRSATARPLYRRLDALNPRRPSRQGLYSVSAGDCIDAGCFRVRVDSKHGALVELRDRMSSRDWADADHPLGLFGYETFGQADYDRFMRDYSVNMDSCRSWAIPDFSKPGIASARARHRVFAPEAVGTWAGARRGADFVLVELRMPGKAWRTAGAPRRLTLEYRFPRHEPAVEIQLQWFEKPANRLPEAMWFSFRPRVAAPRRWLLDKMGRWISPLEVVVNGNRNLHAIQRGVRYDGPDGMLDIESLDVPLVAPGRPRLLRFDNSRPPLKEGMHFNLFNNIFGTNFPMWYEDDGLCRFVLRFNACGKGSRSSAM